MLFTSYGFIGSVLILFLLYYVFPKKLRPALLLVFSLVIYGMADARYLIYIGITVVTVWYAALIIDKNNKAVKDYIKKHKAEMSATERKAYKKLKGRKSLLFFLAGLVLNLGILAVVKYSGFVLSGIGHMLSSGTDGVLNIPDMLIPLGISF